MRTQTIIRFAVLCALLGSSAAATSPAFAQKDGRRSGTAKEDRTQEQNKNNKEARSGSGTNKSEGRGDGSSKGRKDRR